MRKYLLQHILRSSVERYPERIAIGFENDSIRFDDMDYKSTRLANLLLEAGFQPGSAVGIYLNKSIETVIAFFAVLKAGGFYIPLDSSYSPLSRIIRIIHISDVQFIVTHTSLWNTMVGVDPDLDICIKKSLSVIFVDALNGKESLGFDSFCSLSEAGDSFFEYDPSMDTRLKKTISRTDIDLAYVLYTSGSTGVPKGVMISHLNALSFINWSSEYFHPNCDDIFANHAPMHFDLSVFDLYVSMYNGARVDLVPFHISANPRALVDFISKKEISFWYSVPQAWINILNYAHIDRDNCGSLKRILFAGDVFPSKYLKKLMSALPDAKYYNLYGPTETNVCTCYHVINIDSVSDRPVPIGSSCDNTEVIALNENDEPIDLGEEGELFVRGSTVTSGYYKNAKKSAEAFRTSPFLHHNGDLLYCTGDIVVRVDEDNYSYIGRKDLMVKCAGFRIEITEVERAFYSHADISEVVVVAVGDSECTQKRLTAYITTKHDAAISIIELKKHLSRILPKYMIPDSITKVHTIPRNANGKIDRVEVAKWVTIC